MKECGPEATYRKYIIMAWVIEKLSVKQKREIFKLMRTCVEADHNTFLTKYGFTIGEFATFHILTEKDRKRDIDDDPMDDAEVSL